MDNFPFNFNLYDSQFILQEKILITFQDTSAGIIPRALSHLFDELKVLGNQEYSVRVSFLELYNEELFDLLSPSDDASKIRYIIYKLLKIFIMLKNFEKFFTEFMKMQLEKVL